MKFKPGDKIIRIGPSQGSEVQKGEIYTFDRYDGNNDNSFDLILKEFPHRLFNVNRFELAISRINENKLKKVLGIS